MSSANLQPDTGSQTVQLLLQISQQLKNGSGSVPDAIDSLPPFEPPASAIVLNSLLFASLLCSVIASGKCLWIKQWLREYSLDLPHRPRELVRVRVHRHRGLDAWHMRAIVSTISFLLQVSVALFANAVVLLAWPVAPALRYAVFAVALLWVAVTLVAAVCPVVSPACPYKSPLARTFGRVVYWIRRGLGARRKTREEDQHWNRMPRIGEHEEFHTRERHIAVADGASLDLEALTYANMQYWGHRKLDRINDCFKDVENREAALSVIEEIVAARLNVKRDALQDAQAVEARQPRRDRRMLHLMRIWCEIYDEGMMTGRSTIKWAFESIAGRGLHTHGETSEASSVAGADD